MVWAMSKCKFYLTGLQHFDVVTDHRPLIPILNHYSLDAIENPRLQRLKEKLSAFQFSAQWRAGKQLCIPDMLSRYPGSAPIPEEDVLNSEINISVKTVVMLRAGSPQTFLMSKSPQTDNKVMEESIRC